MTAARGYGGAVPGTEAVADKLTWRQVLDWRLFRHRLVPRLATGGIAAVASRLCGLHAQLMSSAELSAAARLIDPSTDDLAACLWERRELVKLWSVRGTLHLLPTAELDQWLAVLGTIGNYRMAEPGTRRLVELVGRALCGRLLTRAELADAVERSPGGEGYGRVLADSWGTALKPASFRGKLCFAPSEGGVVRFTDPASWCGVRPAAALPAARAAVMRRALALHGAVSLDDFVRWWGLSSRQVEGMLVDLGQEVVRVEVDGQAGYALAEHLPLVKQASPQRQVRLLPSFDQWTGTLPRATDAGLAAKHRQEVFRPQGWLSPVILVGHRIRGVWRATRQGTRLSVRLEPFGPLPAWAVRAAEREAERLAALRGLRPQLTWRK